MAEDRNEADGDAAVTPAQPVEGESKRDHLLGSPQLRLVGGMDEAMYAEFRNQLAAAPTDGALVVALTTLGGNPEVARAMADDVRLLREAGREILFLGKAVVYSAGATFMAGFPVENRFLARGTRLMIHERQMQRTVQLNGPLRSCVAQLKAVLNEIEHSIEIEEDGFRDIVEGSEMTFDEVQQKAPENWYLDCKTALEKGLIAEVV